MILVQARSTSSRFPCKHLAPLAGSTVFDILISRIRGVAPFAFLIPTGDPYKEELDKRGVEVFEGPEEDVLKRYALAMEHYNLEWCIRITGDCPLISPQDISWMVNVCTASRFDYGSNFGQAQTDGMEIEYLSRRLIDNADSAKIGKGHYLMVLEDREHVTTWIRNHREYLEALAYRFYDAPVQYGWHGAGKLSIDTPEDLERVEMVMRKMGAA
jgi:spore coat polysaccharide biosynthesis protein SpsF (cytidylyltransferase family)